MKLFFIVTLATLTTASIKARNDAIKPGISLISPPSTHTNRNYTMEEAHANVLKMHLSEHIITSDTLYEYLNDNIGSNHTIYVSDQQKFISMSSVHQKPDKRAVALGERQVACNYYTSTWVEQPASWWNAWEPCSCCEYTGLDPAGGSQSINWGYSLSISENAGLDFSLIADLLGASVGFSVTETWNHGGSASCNVPAYSVGQIWEQNLLAWGWFWQEGCEACQYTTGCGSNYGQFDSKPVGGATAPAASDEWGKGVQVGCSAGSANVDCTASSCTGAGV